MSAPTLETPAPTSRSVTRVMREGDRVWLEGVQGFSFGEKQCSTFATQAELLRTLGEDVAYEDLVAASGLAFRVQAYKASMCPSAAHAMVGQRCVTDMVCTWSLRPIFFGEKSDANYPEKVAAGRAAVRDSIDRGMPVILVGDEDGLIVGYQKGGEEWICLHPMRDGGHTTYVEPNVSWCIALADQKRENMPSRYDAARSAITKAIEMWTADSDRYHVGEKAWEVWIQRLEDANAGKAQPHDMQSGNAWMYDTLIAYRRNAANYLRKAVADFPASAKPHLMKAADLYDEMATRTLLSAGRTCVQIAPYPGSEPNWSQAQREEQIQRLRGAFELDRQAIAELKLALAGE